MIIADDMSVNLNNRAIIRRLNMRFERGKLSVLIGPNGAGKSTTLKALAGLLPLKSGHVWVNDTASVHALMPVERASVIGYLPQERHIAWNLKAVEVAALGVSHLGAKAARMRGFDQLLNLGLQEQADTGVMELSGGQRARVLLARVLASQASVLLLDEPLIALDPIWQRQVLHILRTRARQGVSVVISLHDLHLTAQFADHIIVLDQGAKIIDGTPRDVFTPERLADVFGLEGSFDDRGQHPILSLSPFPKKLSANMVTIGDQA